MNTGLTDLVIKKFSTVFSSHPQVEQVILYGSRAKGTYKPSSDIDLTLAGPHLDLRTLQKIEQELDDLLLPNKIDLSIYHLIENEDLKEHIARVGLTIFRKQPEIS